MAHQIDHTTLQRSPLGISAENRALLERLHRELPNAFDIDDAAEVLALDAHHARRLLAYLARRGWLSRVRRGLYVTVPLDTRRPGEWTGDPWVVAERLFSPCYIGGWSACEHWGLTEQTFRTVLVVTAKAIRERSQLIQGTPFRLTRRSEDKHFGLDVVWRGQVRVNISDPSRTIVDLLDDPTLGGGIRSVADVLYEYLVDEYRDDDRLIEYADRLGNRAVFKRLGFLLEHMNLDGERLSEAALKRRSAGLATLDPSVDNKGQIVRRWGIRANATLGTPGGGQ
jgi:predicted transcriptional regulator of viral defense system